MADARVVAAGARGGQSGAEAMTGAPGARLSFLRLPPLPTGLGFVLVIGGTIAAMAPFDVAFMAATGRSTSARVVLFCFLTLLGAWRAPPAHHLVLPNHARSDAK